MKSVISATVILILFVASIVMGGLGRGAEVGTEITPFVLSAFFSGGAIFSGILTIIGKVIETKSK